MSRIFAIGDIHGCKRTFQKLLEEINIRKSDTIFCIGDYIDRGPDSKGVIDLILDLRKRGFRVSTLRGNHEQMMMESDAKRTDFMDWYINGGDTTLESFGVASFHDFAPEYKDFFKRTRYYFESGPFIFVHAGLNFGPEDLFEDRDAMLWMRNITIDKKKLGDRIIIHGHTPRPLEEIVNPERDDVYNLDAGCVYKDRPGHGYLVALNVTDGEWIAIKNCEG